MLDTDNAAGGKRGPAAPKATPGRRTQQQRREATRAKLLDATLEGLIDLGLVRLTTPEICKRAGVSQGALFKHFPTKARLLSAAAEHLFEGLIRDFRIEFEQVEGASDPVGAAIDAMATVFESPALLASFDLYTASRTDPDLAADLAPVLERHFANIMEVARTVFPATATERPEFPALILASVYVMQGAALGGLAAPNPELIAHLNQSLAALARTFLLAPADPA